MKKLTITLNDYFTQCTDGCCSDYGTITTVNGIELPCHNTDAATILRQILEHLGYEVEVVEMLNGRNINDSFFYEPTGQDVLTNGTIIYNFETKEEDIIVDYKNGRSSITAKGRHFHVSANMLGDGWKAVRKTHR